MQAMNLDLCNNGEEAKAISIDMLLERTALSRPYFSFRHLYTLPENEWDVYGEVRSERYLGAEIGPITVAEACRHLIILGACAGVIKSDPVPAVCFRPACAVWQRHRSSGGGELRGSLTCRARVLDRGPATLKSEIQICDGDAGIGTLLTQYYALRMTSFDYIFSEAKRVTLKEDWGDPYANQIQMAFSSSDSARIFGRSEGYGPDYSAGYFHNYPMWSLASITRAIEQSTTKILQRMFGPQVKYEIDFSAIHGVELIPASETLEFETSVMHRDGGRCAVSSRVRYRAKEIAEVHSTLVLVDESHDPTRPSRW